MKRWLLYGIGLLGLIGAQVLVVPRFLPRGWMPDLFLLTVILWGFLVPDGRAGWAGLALGGLQGWLHGSGFLPLSLSRGFAGWLSSWLRRRWLWFSFPAGLFCLGTTTLLTEGLTGILFSIGERSGAPFLQGWQLGLWEAINNMLIGGCFLWFRRGD